MDTKLKEFQTFLIKRFLLVMIIVILIVMVSVVWDIIKIRRNEGQ
jgi:hypothetical protein